MHDILFFYCPDKHQFKSKSFSDWRYATPENNYEDYEKINITVIDLKDGYHYDSPNDLIELDMSKDEFANKFKLIEKFKS